MAGMSPTTATNIMTKAEEKNRAQTAFGIALNQAASQREQSMINLGVDITNQGGKVLNPEEASDVFAPGQKGRADVTMTTGYGEGAIPSVVKEGVTATGEAVNALTERGVGGSSGLVGQQRVIGADAVQLAKQAAIQAAQGEIAQANASTIEEQAALTAAQAAENTARGIKGGPKVKKKKNIWGGKVHDAKGKTIRDATKKEIAAVKAANKKKKGG